ncbi:MAG: MATE family efflux transporter [Spirochaetales bacterium]|nr:MATE family efflux transporter [Spirochaetales bacterium]
MNIVRLVWPIFIESFLRILFMNVDIWMLSAYSEKAVAAAGLIMQINFFIIILFTLTTSGMAILISQYLGAKKEKEAGETATIAIFMIFLFGLFLSTFFYLFSEFIVGIFGLEPAVAGYANEYLRISGTFCFVEGLSVTMVYILRSHGHPKVSMFTSLGANLLNIFGNACFIFGLFGLPVLGVTGVALSTVVSKFCGFIIMALILKFKTNIHFPITKIRHIPIKRAVEILKIGIPSAGEVLSYNIAQMVTYYIIARLGTHSLEAYALLNTLMRFIFITALSMGQGTQVLVSYLVGAGEKKQAFKKTLKYLKFAIFISFTIAAILSLFRVPLLGIFNPSDEVLNLAGTLILLTMVLEPGRAFNLIIINALKGSGDVRFPVMMGIIFMWGVSVLFSYLLGLHFGLGIMGVWIAFSMDEWTRGLIMLWRWISRRWEKKVLIRHLEAADTEAH